jgi:hypothetical protein
LVSLLFNLFHLLLLCFNSSISFNNCICFKLCLTKHPCESGLSCPQ